MSIKIIVITSFIGLSLLSCSKRNDIDLNKSNESIINHPNIFPINQNSKNFQITIIDDTQNNQSKTLLIQLIPKTFINSGIIQLTNPIKAESGFGGSSTGSTGIGLDTWELNPGEYEIIFTCTSKNQPVSATHSFTIFKRDEFIAPRKDDPAQIGKEISHFNFIHLIARLSTLSNNKNKNILDTQYIIIELQDHKYSKPRYFNY